MTTTAPTIQGMKDFCEGRTIRKCKIIGTLGPSSSSKEKIRELVEAGMDIARLNFSHGSHATHLQNIEHIRAVARETKRNVTILQDLQGPKIRCGELIGGMMRIEKSLTYTLVSGTDQEDQHSIPIDYPNLANDIRQGEKIMMDDGTLSFLILEVGDSHVKIEAENSGLLKSRKSVNFPTSQLSLPSITEKDNRDLLFGVTNEVDIIALSFVQNPDDIKRCRAMINALGSNIPIVAKIEKLSAVEQIDSIAALADGLMVARGDLGVECGVEKVPLFQRKILAAGSEQAKPVIIATQMLESMIQSPQASPAEIADVANGVLEGADCVMLSAEVATGQQPTACISQMDSIIREVEAWNYMKSSRSVNHLTTNRSWLGHEAIAIAACEAAEKVKASAIICLTLTGSMAKLISSWRPTTPIIAISPRKKVINSLGLVWGVSGMQNQLFYDTDVLLQDLPQFLKSLSIVRSGDTIVITAGIPLKAVNSSNMFKINKIP